MEEARGFQVIVPLTGLQTEAAAEVIWEDHAAVNPSDRSLSRLGFLWVHCLGLFIPGGLANDEKDSGVGERESQLHHH